MKKTRPTELNLQELMNHSHQKMHQNQQAKKGEKGKNTDFKKSRKKKIGQAVFSKQVISRKEPFGRPPQLDMQTAARICEHLRAGLFIQSALAAEAIPRRTYYYWIEQGEADLELTKSSIYVDFLHMIKKAEVETEMKNIMAVQAGEFGWQGAAWWLERKYPARWSTRMRLTLEEAQDFARKILGVLAEEIPDKSVLERIIKKIRTIQGEQRDLVATGSHVR